MRRMRCWLAVIALVFVLVLALPAFAYAQTEAGTTAARVDPDGIVPLVGSALFVVAVVNGLKKLYGLSGQRLMIVAMLLGVALQVAVYFFADSELFARVMIGILYGGGASGLWVLSRSSPEA